MHQHGLNVQGDTWYMTMMDVADKHASSTSDTHAGKEKQSIDRSQDLRTRISYARRLQHNIIFPVCADGDTGIRRPFDRSQSKSPSLR